MLRFSAEGADLVINAQLTPDLIGDGHSMTKRKAAGETLPQHIRAQFNGAVRIGGASLFHDLSGDCMKPFTTVTQGWQSESAVFGTSNSSNYTERLVRCRKCDKCRAAKARHWAARISSEARLWPRSWFVTMTFSIEEHIRYEYAGIDPGKAATDMFKRMRKHGLNFRYVLVTEKHKSGLPHWHAILHEMTEGTFTSRSLSGNQKEGIPSRWWPHGHLHCRLLPPNNHKVAWYVCKYVSKDAENRIRASLSYGKTA